MDNDVTRNDKFWIIFLNNNLLWETSWEKKCLLLTVFWWWIRVYIHVNCPLLLVRLWRYPLTRDVFWEKIIDNNWKCASQNCNTTKELISDTMCYINYIQDYFCCTKIEVHSRNRYNFKENNNFPTNTSLKSSIMRRLSLYQKISQEYHFF